ncbi:DNA processing protein [Rosenbergiella nectarea]|uniref:DNA processing protein n=1 Tax=Rosenbergiella nectarea TaxID=988801 RepID=A0A1H9MV82_9GAMM|nr:DNA-processing protein DprA [Rosenbergiella nectarea]SER27616.1 DNA processing protein [Rosenbergiella nectarea]
MQTKFEEIETWLRCVAIKNIKYPDRLYLLDALQQYSQISRDTLRQLRLTERQISQYNGFSAREITRAQRWITDKDQHFIHYYHPYYPESLKQCASPPLYLFASGNVELLGKVQLAIVGSRNCSYYGRYWAAKLSSDIACHNVVITSGLAVGIDAIAHRAASSSSGETIAVLGSGLGHIYPPENISLYKEIIDKGGLVVSEFPLGVPPIGVNFPRRNRIISGLSAGTLVVEASLRSGSLITARYALEQNRNVYALPGSLHSPSSAGCHWLIQQGGLLVREAGDIIEDLHSAHPSVLYPPLKSINFEQSDKVPLPFASLLANVGDEVTSVDVVAERAGQPVPETVVALLELELAGWIAAVPGGYVRLRRASHVRRSNVLV